MSSMQAQLRLDLPWRADCGGQHEMQGWRWIRASVAGAQAGRCRQLEARLRFGHRNAEFIFPERCTFVLPSFDFLLRLPSHFASSPQRKHGSSSTPRSSPNLLLF